MSLMQTKGKSGTMSIGFKNRSPDVQDQLEHPALFCAAAAPAHVGFMLPLNPFVRCRSSDLETRIFATNLHDNLCRCQTVPPSPVVIPSPPRRISSSTWCPESRN